MLIFSSLTPITIEVKGREGLEAQEQLQDKKKISKVKLRRKENAFQKYWKNSPKKGEYSQKHFRV